MKVLIAEDEPLIREGLETFLLREGFEPRGVPDGRTALSTFDSWKPEFVILDIMMPGLGGYDVCRELRRRDGDVPILFLSARGEEIDRVVGLELGADDYLVKPFGTRELLARMNAILRRARRVPDAARESETTFEMAGLVVHPQELRARRGETSVDLGPRDLAVLRLLWRKAGKVVDRQEMFETCWGASFPGSTRSVDQHMSQLRRKIESNPADPRIIRTVHGAGYRYEP